MFFNSPDIGLDRAAPGTFSLSVTCHGPDVSHRQAGLRLDLDGSAGTLQNELIRRTSATDPSERMPPPNSGKTPLTPAQIELLKTWLKQGAPWQPFWSFIPPKRPELPKIDGSDIGFPLNPIDTFIVSRLEREGLHPTHEAEKRLLIRRVSLDLTGLPPTPAEVADFAGDPEPNAYERVVDRLLASPSDGEKMAYRWMENARYGDSNGYQTDGPRDMWRWRDWVIDAFNRNMPWDQFTVAQLAGDLLPNTQPDDIVATGFNRNHRTTGEGGIIPEEYRVEYVADRAQTTATLWMGLTVGCARCHDHKYNPFRRRISTASLPSSIRCPANAVSPGTTAPSSPSSKRQHPLNKTNSTRSTASSNHDRKPGTTSSPGSLQNEANGIPARGRPPATSFSAKRAKARTKANPPNSITSIPSPSPPGSSLIRPTAQSSPIRKTTSKARATASF